MSDQESLENSTDINQNDHLETNLNKDELAIEETSMKKEMSNENTAEEEAESNQSAEENDNEIEQSNQEKSETEEPSPDDTTDSAPDAEEEEEEEEGEEDDELETENNQNSPTDQDDNEMKLAPKDSTSSLSSEPVVVDLPDTINGVSNDPNQSNNANTIADDSSIIVKSQDGESTVGSQTVVIEEDEIDFDQLNPRTDTTQYDLLQHATINVVNTPDEKVTELLDKIRTLLLVDFKPNSPNQIHELYDEQCIILEKMYDTHEIECIQGSDKVKELNSSTAILFDKRIIHSITICNSNLVFILWEGENDKLTLEHGTETLLFNEQGLVMYHTSSGKVNQKVQTVLEDFLGLFG